MDDTWDTLEAWGLAEGKKESWEACSSSGAPVVPQIDMRGSKRLQIPERRHQQISQIENLPTNPEKIHPQEKFERST